MTNQIDSAAVLDRVVEFCGRFLVFPSEHCLPTVALWIAHTHAPTSFYVSPRLVLDSAEPGSGKTRVLEVAALLCRNPEMTISATTAAIFRMIADEPITLLFDEVDAIFSPKNGGNYEDLRALLNAGYKRGATIARCVGDAKAMKVQRFAVYSAVALAGIAGNMPATITTRSVTIHMRRRAPNETVEPFRERYAGPQAEPIRSELAAWIGSIAAALAEAEPRMPEGVADRPAEVWEALLAIADAAGGHWPETARAACRHFVLDRAPEGVSLGQRLLADARRVFGDAEEMRSEDLVAALIGLEESPWADLWGKPLDARRLAKELAKYEVAPAHYRDKANGKTVRGYTTYAVRTERASSAGLADAWRRYLPTEAASRGNECNECNDAGQTPLHIESPCVTGVTAPEERYTRYTSITHAEPPLTSDVTPVTPVTSKTGSADAERQVDIFGDEHPVPPRQPADRTPADTPPPATTSPTGVWLASGQPVNS